jgi:hypothetical protein
MTERIIDWNPDEGDALQGDVCLFRLPAKIKLGKDATEIAARDNKLILAEGEITGHHHAIWNPEIPRFRDDGLARDLAVELNVPVGTARLYRSPLTIDALVSAGELTTNTLAIGILEIKGEPMVLRHDEHNGIRIPVGSYYVGGQREWDAAQERRVQD